MANSRFLLIASIFILTSLVVHSQDLSETLETCFREGDASKLSAHFDQSIDLGLPYADQDYSKKQGELVMADFFRKMPATSFKIIEKGSTGKNSHFMIGEYLTGEKSYNVLIMLNDDGIRPLIHKIKFEEKKP